ncbi:MAG: hypothetical protein HQK76_18015 [Desulfobacterales bacterium]|nr:hypothetical protein [Desulfobacterales bacterium]
MGQKLINQLSIISLMLFFIVNIAFCESIDGFENINLPSKGGTKQEQITREIIKRSQIFAANHYLKKNSMNVIFEKPIQLIKLNVDYTAITFNVSVKNSNGEQKKGIFQLLFEKYNSNEMRFSNDYLSWVGEQEIEEYKNIPQNTLCRYYLNSCIPTKRTEDQEKEYENILRYVELSMKSNKNLEEIENLKNRIKELESNVKHLSELESTVKHLVNLFSAVSKDGNKIVFTGVNLQIVNGTGKTETSNGVGNLIVGYNEPDSKNRLKTTGSHNIAVGQKNSYTSFGGIVSGEDNEISGKYSAVLSGKENKADGKFATIIGGNNNSAQGDYSNINGGTNRTVTNTNPHFLKKEN